MGKRGRNRSGYHLAVLYALEAHYSLLSLAGEEPARWQPLPRNRPDQFLQWLLHCLDTLGIARPETLCALLDKLEGKGLSHVAMVLAWALKADTAWQEREDKARLPLEPSWPAGKEEHPQVRKYAKAIGSSLDPAWQRALALAQHEAAEDWPKGVVLLGGLPLDLNVIGEQVFSQLVELEALGGYRELTVQQCYGLISGSLPEPPAPWRDALYAIRHFDDDELQLLKSLSETQLEQVHALSDQAVTLIIQEREHYSSLQWHAIAGLLASITHEDFEQVIAVLSSLRGMSAKERERYLLAKLKTLRSGNISLKFLISHGASRGKRFLRMLQDSDPATWRQLQTLDEEVFRLIVSRTLSPQLRRRLQRSSLKQWQEVRALLNEHDMWVSGYLADSQAVEELRTARSAAQLSLAELFPRSMAHLNNYYRDNLTELLLEEVGEVELSARAFHERVRQHLLHELQLAPKCAPKR